MTNISILMYSKNTLFHRQSIHFFYTNFKINLTFENCIARYNSVLFIIYNNWNKLEIGPQNVLDATSSAKNIWTFQIMKFDTYS